MTPTRPSTLLTLAAVAGVLGLLLGTTAYGSLPPLPVYAPVSLVMLGVFELGLARAVRARLRGPVRGRQMHPLQVARAAALAQASSACGALVLGGYGGLLAHVVRLDAEQAKADAVVCAVAVAGAALLVVAALVLERACRTPDLPDDRGLGSDP